MINLVGFVWGPDGQKCFLWVLLGFVVWGSEKLFLGVLHKLKFKKKKNIQTMIHRKKSLKKLFFMKGQTNVPKKSKGFSLGLGFQFFEYLGFGFGFKYFANLSQISN